MLRTAFVILIACGVSEPAHAHWQEPVNWIRDHAMIVDAAGRDACDEVDQRKELPSTFPVWQTAEVTCLNGSTWLVEWVRTSDGKVTAKVRRR